ncbi:hypothetical protein ACMGDK_11315 [Chryseobacterium sp. DT-3]|uniref:hypothetical protein n=1 Tax=Chryseobacterium sp. DT-3 TaxID=3396164 RepID=UPI003F1B2947
MLKKILIAIAFIFIFFIGFILGKQSNARGKFYFGVEGHTPYLFDTKNGTIYIKRSNKIDKINYMVDYEKQTKKIK